MTGPRLALLVESGSRRRVWEEVVPELDRAGVEVLAGTVFPRGPLHDQWERLGWETFSLDARTSRDYPRAALRLRRVLRRRDVPLVHATETIPAFVAGLATLGSSRRSIFHRQHCAWDENPQMARLSRYAARLTDCTLACSQAAADSAHEVDGVDRSRIRIAYNAANRQPEVPEARLRELRDRIWVPEDREVVLCVARLRPEKGLDVFVEALAAGEAKLGRPLQGVIVGDGPCRADTERLAAKLGVAVHFAGHQDDVAPWYALADVVAVPSRREPFGVVAVEAMSAGKPLVASRVQGLAEIVVDGESGVLVPPGDPDSLAAAISRLLGEPAYRARIAAAGYARFEDRFTNEAMVRAWMGCWSELLPA